MKQISIVVKAIWDDDAQVWSAYSTDIQGLAIEAASFDVLRERVLAAVCELIELNGIESDSPDIPVHIMAESLARLPNPCH